MITLITNKKSPKVIMVSGRVTKIISGFTIKLSTANTSAKIIAVLIELMDTYGDNTLESINTATAVIRILITNLIIIFLVSYCLIFNTPNYSTRQAIVVTGFIFTPTQICVRVLNAVVPAASLLNIHKAKEPG